MAEAGADEFAEFGAAALDAFQALFEETEHLDHRGDDDHARELLGDLLIDLMHYAEHRGLEFNDVLAQAHGYYLSESNSPDVFPIGSAVQLDGPAADEAILLGRPTRGSVTGLLIPDHGPTEYYVHFLGETNNQKVIAADLRPAPPFPATTTAEGVIDDPLRAEEILLQTMTLIGQADIQGVQPHQDDLNDQRVLLDAFVTWNDMERHNVTDLLLTKVEPRLETYAPHTPTAHKRLGPGQLAAQAFPVAPTEGLPNQSPTARRASAQGPADAPTRRRSR